MNITTIVGQMSKNFTSTRIDKELKDELRQRTNNKCIYCGLDLFPETRDILDKSKQCSIEHIIPQAVYKWVKEICDEQEINEMRKLCNHKDNLAVTHYFCNNNRSSKLLDKNNISSLKCGEDLKEKYIKTLDKNSKYITKYKSVVNTVLAVQNKRCAVCYRSLNLKNITLRRINNKKARTIDNCIALCSSSRCNQQYRILWRN